jgi:hypothetical protein
MEGKKVNTSLVARIGGFLKGLSSTPARPLPRREETTETSTTAGVIDYYYQLVKLERTRRAKYNDYEIMDEEYPEISTAIDAFADNATKERDAEGDVIGLKSQDPRVKNILGEMIERVGIQEMMWDTARLMEKGGDDFDEVIVNADSDIVRLKPLKQSTMYVNIDEFGRLKEKPYKQMDDSGITDVAEFEPWQIVHWKNGGQKKMYGESILKPVRRVYKQLQLMEDGMVIGRLTRSHLRYKVLVDVSGLEKEDADKRVEDVKKRMKKKRLVNPVTGKLETESNPLTAEEDFFIGVSEESKADVGVLQGATNLGNIRDVEYFQNKLFAGLKVPKAFLGFEKEVKAKATLVEEDIQFARGVGRIRKGLRAGLRQVFDYQLKLKGIVPAKGLYTIEFALISMVDEVRKYTIEKLKADIAKIYKVDMNILTDEYILKNYIGVPDEEIAGIIKKLPKVPPTPSTQTRGTPSTRAGGLSGTATPKLSVVKPTKEAEDPVATYRLIDLLETFKDLIELEREG